MLISTQNRMSFLSDSSLEPVIIQGDSSASLPFQPLGSLAGHRAVYNVKDAQIAALFTSLSFFPIHLRLQ